VIDLISNALKLTETVIRMINRNRSRKTIRSINKLLKKIRRMEEIPYEERIDGDLDRNYNDLNLKLHQLGKENSRTQNE
jgi:Holliday junction resolvasome RuvABC ATP-dependent DNA helicase subunit